MTDPPEPDPDLDLAHAAGRRAERRRSWLVHGERPLARNLAMIGALGWLVVTPTLAGVFAGRWLDRRLGGGVLWTGALLMAGVGLGCWMAWRRVQQIQKEDGP